MRYQKAIDLWADHNTEKLLSGELVLQCGQWIHCGSDGIKSRYVGTNGRSIDAVHGKDAKQVIEKFKERMFFKNATREQLNSYMNRGSK